MKAVILIIALVAGPVMAGTTNVKGYIRKDGTYVAPSVRTTPNETKNDNYSTQGNYNPRTGEAGTVDPYKQTRANPYRTPASKPRKSGSGY